MTSQYDSTLCEIVGEFYKLSKQTPPSSPACQALVERWQNYLSQSHYECTLEMLECLGKMYPSEEFKDKIDVFGEGTADFMSRAILIYCENKKSSSKA